MRTSRLSTVLVSALAVVALAATGCKKKNDPAPPPPECTLAPLDASCAVDGDCCSGNCFVASGQTVGTCVKADGTCAVNGATCAVRSDCCEASCKPDNTCGPPGSCGLADGTSCGQSDQCCSRMCAGPSGAKTCIQPGCFNLGWQCATGSDCCSGYCDGTNKCAPPPDGGGCVDDSNACSADTQCCSKKCKGGLCAPVGDTCKYEGESCDSDAQCCGLICLNVGTAGATCSPGLCTPLDHPCSQASNLCCSGTCGVGNVCAPPPSGATGQTCATLHEACALPGDCCSKNCQGASGTGVKNGTCMPIASCNAFGDICYRSEDCCSGLCTATGGAAGRCDDAPGGCGQDGYPCTADSNCCTKQCVPSGTGGMVCETSGGCRMNGNYCDTTASCCNINDQVSQSQWITCDPTEHLCTNGGSCNPPGDICGYKASQNCCHTGGGSGSQVCKPDSNGIMRCYGGWVDPPSCVDTATYHCCRTGWDGTDPLCCIHAGDVCQFRDQCCDGSPCTMADDGVLRCTPPVCLPTGATCSTAAAPPNGYTAVQGDCCAPNKCYYVGIEVGWRCADTQPPPTCLLPDATCTSGGTACCFGSCTNGKCGGACTPTGSACTGNAQCCSGVCDGNVCRPPCVPSTGSCTVTSDCCSGLTCEIPAGATQGTCTTGGGGGDPPCANTGQSCTAMACCLTTDSCTSGVCTAPVQCRQTAQACTAAGQAECCNGLQCYMLTGLEERVDCAAGNSCFCDVPTCAPTSAACSTIVPCCNAVCTDNATGGQCASTDTAACTCHVPG